VITDWIDIILVGESRVKYEFAIWVSIVILIIPLTFRKSLVGLFKYTKNSLSWIGYNLLSLTSAVVLILLFILLINQYDFHLTLLELFYHFYGNRT
jgi:hypothetical protein